jgi:hypothetical protein
MMQAWWPWQLCFGIYPSSGPFVGRQSVKDVGKQAWTRPGRIWGSSERWFGSNGTDNRRERRTRARACPDSALSLVHVLISSRTMFMSRRGRLPTALLAIAVAACGRQKNNASEPAPVGDDSTTRSDEPTTSRETFAPSSDHQGSDEGDPTLIPELPTNEQIDPGGAACTPDLRSVVDGAGRLIQECPNDQGCAAGECVAACDAAARSSGSMGCEFWAPTPPLEAHLTMCHAVFWPTPGIAPPSCA